MFSQMVLVESHEEVLFNPTGAAGRWASKVAAEMTRAIKSEAPSGRDSGRVNKSRQNASEPVGSLKRGISSSSTRTGPTSLSITTVSTASYTLYVLRGTRTKFATSGRYPAGAPGGVGGQFIPIGKGVGMYLPANPGYGRSKFVQKRRGQRANNFMQRGVDRVAAKHSSIAGFRVG